MQFKNGKVRLHLNAFTAIQLTCREILEAKQAAENWTLEPDLTTVRHSKVSYSCNHCQLIFIYYLLGILFF